MEPIAPQNVGISFINKSGRRARIYQSDRFGYEIHYRFFLRPNEPRSLSYTPDGTFWVAYDFTTNALLLINGQPRMETVQNPRGVMVAATVHSNFLRPEPLGNMPAKPLFIETLVVLDPSFLKHYGMEQATSYTLVLMNMVARTFTHKSLSIPILVVLSNIIPMKEKPEYYKIEPNRPEISVSAACRYAGENAGNASVDFALILTRENIGPAGYASMYTMCTKRSCALVRDSGPDTAFVIAHEIGHALGIGHDEDNGCVRASSGGSNIMVKRIYSTSSNYQWSSCSKRMLRQNLRYFRCIKNVPVLLPVFKHNMNYLPGESLNLTAQCKSYRGKDALPCTLRMSTRCKYLWCRKNRISHCEPVWWHAPLEGTSCAVNRWCLRGQCMKKVKRVLVHGNWSNWSSFEPPCESHQRMWLIQRRNRTCDNPKPQGGGQECSGTSKEYRIVLPADDKTCKIYSLTELIMNKWIDTNSLASMGCQKSRHRNKTWISYSREMQQKHISSLNLTCNFESTNCGWKSSKVGTMPWIFGRGKSPSMYTGPEYDHTFKNMSGHYLYFETSGLGDGRRLRKGSTVVLESPMILAPSLCLEFAYHMFGRDMGALNVFIRNGKHKRKVWYKTGPQGQSWQKAKIDLKVNIEYKITIEAVRGRSYYSDIAIDDLSLSFGLCGHKQGVKECHSVCIDTNSKQMHVAQTVDGTPCKLVSSIDSVCFNRTCQPVNCRGIIGKSDC